MSDEKKPKAIITIARATAQEESVQVTVNADEVTQEAIYSAIKAAGDALVQRLEENNQKLVSVRDPIPALKSRGR
jgi:hypothetical protein